MRNYYINDLQNIFLPPMAAEIKRPLLPSPDAITAIIHEFGGETDV